MFKLENICISNNTICIISDENYENKTRKIHEGSMPTSNGISTGMYNWVTTKHWTLIQWHSRNVEHVTGQLRTKENTNPLCSWI